MSRTYSMITWGLALILSAAILAATKSIPWTLTAAGAVPLVSGLIQGSADNADEARRTKGQEQGAEYNASRSDSF